MLAREFRADYLSKSERTATLDIAAKSLVAKASRSETSSSASVGSCEPGHHRVRGLNVLVRIGRVISNGVYRSLGQWPICKLRADPETVGCGKEEIWQWTGLQPQVYLA